MRTIGAVILGYLAMALVVFGGLTVAYLAMGSDTAFRADSFEVSTVWSAVSLAVSLAVGFGAAVLGLWLARRVGRTPTAPRALALAVLVLGAMFALPALPAASST